jgi:hypothetical protein
VQAYMWLDIAVTRADKDPARFFRASAIDRRDKIAADMTSEQIAEAKHKAVKWLASHPLSDSRGAGDPFAKHVQAIARAERLMTKYRMKIYRPGDPVPRLWHTHDIFAADDAMAKTLAQERYDELAQELAQQQEPKIDDPTLVNYCLYDGERLVCETIPTKRR